MGGEESGNGHRHFAACPPVRLHAAAAYLPSAPEPISRPRPKAPTSALIGPTLSCSARSSASETKESSLYPRTVVFPFCGHARAGPHSSSSLSPRGSSRPLNGLLNSRHADLFRLRFLVLVVALGPSPAKDPQAEEGAEEDERDRR